VLIETPLATALAAAYGVADALHGERMVRIANDVVRIEIAGRTYWLKLGNKTVTALDELEAEAEIVAGLAAQGLAVAPPVGRVDGRFAGLLELPEGPCSAVLFYEAPGVELDQASADQAEALGALLATLHGVPVPPAAARRAAIDADTLARVPLRRIQPWLVQAGFDVTALAAFADEMIARAWPRAAVPLPVGLCHGDIHFENVRFDDAFPTLFDFEACGLGPCVYDLACYWRKRIGLAPPGAPPPSAEWDALLRGYTRVRPLAPEELRAIPALATLRAIWIMALPAAPQARWGRDWLVDPEYFAAHLAMIARLADAARLAR
jgi:Ser/Thr protein kinase RdoA (MazF antagonist)